MTVRKGRHLEASPERATSRALRDALHTRSRSGAAPDGHLEEVFFLFSNRLGCFGSIVLSAILTLVLLLVLDVL